MLSSQQLMIIHVHDHDIITPHGKFPEGCFDRGFPIACEDDRKADRNNACIWPECYYPLDNIQQKGQDDNCKYPACYISLSDGNTTD